VVTDTPAPPGADAAFPFKITRTSAFRARVQAFKRADAVLFMNVSLHGLPAARLAGTPAVLSHHGVYGGAGPAGRVLALCKRRLAFFYPNIAVSAFVAGHIQAASTVIPNAYDSAQFSAPGPAVRERDFVFCGRLVNDKGADLCVRAFARLLREIPDASLTLVGDGPEAGALRQLAEALGAAGRTRFTGALSGRALADELRRHACLAAPSLCEEGFGIVALEGIACCDTLIVSRRGGLPEAAGPCGLRVEPTADALAEAMKAVALARRQGRPLPGQPDPQTRRDHLARHAPQAVAGQYLRVIEAALAGPRAKP
jgi:glycosyltransferase involved in cell wall biosynthesis